MLGKRVPPPPPPPPKKGGTMPQQSSGTATAVQVYTPQTISYEVSLKKGMGNVSKRVIVVELQKHLVTQLLSGNETKSHPCREYARLRRRGAEMEVVLDDCNGKRRKKWLIFRSASEALSFEQVIQLEKCCGDRLQVIFNQIDKDASGRIGEKDLQLSIAEFCIANADIAGMLDVVGDGSDSLAYTAFFQLFLECSSPDQMLNTAGQCLEYWRQLALTSATNSTVFTHQNKHDSFGSSGSSAKKCNDLISLKEASLAPSDYFLPGESLVHIVEHVKYSLEQQPIGGSVSLRANRHSGIELIGVLYVTNYRIRVVAYESCLRTRGLRARAAKYLGRGVPESCFGDVSQPHGATHRIDKEGSRELRIISRDTTRCLSLRFEADGIFVDTVKKTFEDYAFPKDPDQISDKAHADVARAEHTFAFSYKFDVNGGGKNQDTTNSLISSSSSSCIDGWTLFEPKREYYRLGFFTDESARESNAWRLWADQYQLSDTYPFEYVVPKLIKDSALEEAAKYRSKRRLPVAVWRSKRTGAILCRSSQPLAGLSQKSSRADQALLDLYRTQGYVKSKALVAAPASTYSNNKPHQTDSTLSPPLSTKNTHHNRSSRRVHRRISVLDRPLHIVDCRGRTAALANHAQGKGTESVGDYKNATLKYCDIGNIHTMRESQQALVETLALFGEKSCTDEDSEKLLLHANIETCGGGSSSAAHSSSRTSSAAPKIKAASTLSDSLLSNLEATGWLKHLLLILRAATHVADRLENQGASCLVHCSDGWDRTAQVCALTQILLDPYYRTIQGIGILIEKEWCSFGHKFSDRLGVARRPDFREKERSPVFIQWLEAVAFVIEQFPKAFEYNEELLIFLADASTSALFGTFLGDTERQRKWEMRAPKRTVSVWTYILNCPSSRFINPNFLAYKGPLWPYVNAKRVHVWHRFYSRWDSAMHPPACPLLSDHVWLNDYGDHFLHGTTHNCTLQRKHSSTHHRSGRLSLDASVDDTQQLHDDDFQEATDEIIEDDEYYDEDDEEDDDDDELVVVDDPSADVDHTLSQRSQSSESNSRKFSNSPFIEQDFYL